MKISEKHTAPEYWLIRTLTPREKDCVRLILADLCDKQIASELGLTYWTVHGYLQSAFKKLNVQSRLKAALLLQQWEQAHPPEPGHSAKR